MVDYYLLIKKSILFLFGKTHFVDICHNKIPHSLLFIIYFKHLILIVLLLISIKQKKLCAICK